MRVGIDSATLVYAELESSPLDRVRIERMMVLALLAGLLHDLCRGEKDHACVGAKEAAKALRNYPLSEEETQGVCRAIHNHEAFITPRPCKRPLSQLLSDCLYDADKFRWGPDNFTHTLWYMVAHQKLTPEELIRRFPWGMAGVMRIQETFRTPTGRHFGPQVIESGISIGKEIYRYLVQNFGERRNGQ